jgi:hypothetical protein
MLARLNPTGTSWFALPLTGDVVARLKRQMRQSEAVRETGGTFDSQYFFTHLSPSSTAALSQADGMRRRNGQNELHMEHLVMGLFLKEHGPAHELFGASGIESERKLREVLDEATDLDLPQPGTYELPDLTALPPVSTHVQEALVHAQAAVRGKESTQIRSRHLLYGCRGHLGSDEESGGSEESVG